jgi:hypothetical protein
MPQPAIIDGSRRSAIAQGKVRPFDSAEKPDSDNLPKYNKDSPQAGASGLGSIA